MILTKLGSVAFRLAHKNVLLQRLPIQRTKTLLVSQSRNLSSKSENLDDLDKPIKFSSSEAAAWKAEYSRIGGNADDAPWFQGYVVLASTAVFLIYFCILREENDMDEKLFVPLVDHFNAEHREQLEATMKLPEKHAQKSINQ